MNSFKLLTLLLVVGAGLFACKDANTTVTATATETTTDAVPSNSEPAPINGLEANKQEALNNLNAYEAEINKEIDNFKAQLQTVNDEAKAGIKAKLADLEQLRSKIQVASTNVGNATEETWASVSSDFEGLSYQIKQVIKPGEHKLSAKQ